MNSTWRLLLTAQAVGAVTNLLRYLQNLGDADAGEEFVLNTVIICVAALLIVLASIRAARLCRAGAPPLRTYALGLVAASCISATVEAICQRLLPPLSSATSPALPEWVAFAMDTAYVLGVGGVGMLAYHNRRRVTQIIEGIRASEFRNVQLQGQLIDSQLAATRAQVDPNELFASLAGIRDMYASSDPGADGQLNRLIEELRDRRIASGAAQPQLARRS